MSRLELAKIPSLTFYQDGLTVARRTKPISQLICRGTPCSLYQPEVVRCVSLPDGYGTEVDWKCEADLPGSLRFGRVEVSCEGWSKPGDPYVLKGSCSLEYRLVQVPSTLRNTDDSPLSKLREYDLLSIVFSVIWAVFLFFILYSFFLSCFRRNRIQAPEASNSRPRPGPSSGWFPGGMGQGDDQDSRPPPPPYSKNPEGANQGWRPGFWSGAAMGGLLNHLYNRRQAPPTQPRPTTWDWERPRPQPSFFSGFSRRPSTTTYTRPDDRGEGSSNLGSMRRSTGLGGSNVR